MKLKSKNFWSVVMIIFIIAFDQITKYFAKSALYPDKAKKYRSRLFAFQRRKMVFYSFNGIGCCMYSGLYVY